MSWTSSRCDAPLKPVVIELTTCEFDSIGVEPADTASSCASAPRPSDLIASAPINGASPEDRRVRQVACTNFMVNDAPDALIGPGSISNVFFSTSSSSMSGVAAFRTLPLTFALTNL